MRKILGTIGATLAIVVVLTTSTAAANASGELDMDGDQATLVSDDAKSFGAASLNPEPARILDALVNVFDAIVAQDVDGDGFGDETQDPSGGGIGTDWQDDWYEDSESGDQLDEDFSLQLTAPAIVSTQDAPQFGFDVSVQTAGDPMSDGCHDAGVDLTMATSAVPAGSRPDELVCAATRI
jgi:hypothetical protein